MKPVLLIDFGSTYTKLTAVDVESETLLGTASSYTTVQTDINDGLTKGLALLEEKTGKIEYAETYACSSAAGGLRMVTSGLVPELTGEAAKLASLGAGAKVVGIYAFQLTEDDLEDIAAQKPDKFYRKNCSFVLENRAGSTAEFERLLDEFMDNILFMEE